MFKIDQVSFPGVFKRAESIHVINMIWTSQNSDLKRNCIILVKNLLDSQNHLLYTCWRAKIVSEEQETLASFISFYWMFYLVIITDQYSELETNFMTMDSSQWVHQHLCIWILRPLSYEELSNKIQWIFAPDSSHQRTVRCFITVRCYKTASQ